MYIQLTIVETPTGWEVTLADENGAPARNSAGGPLQQQPRLLGRVDSGGQVFPLPPAGLPAGLQPGQLADLLTAIFEQAGGADSVARFGHYLFECLLGADLWNAIDEAAGQQPIELALTYPAGDAVLNRLPWEAMCIRPPEAGLGWENFVAAQPEMVLTRRPGGTRGAAFPQVALASPAKVLFVVGAEMTDPVIRPGAEFMGLLRGLVGEGHFLNVRLLAEARVKDLENALREYQPSIIHFTCHGATRMSDGKAVIQLRSDETGAQPHEISAAELIGVLRSSGSPALPAVIVLNACATAASLQVEVGRPFAAELIESGVGAVVGMAGPVADLACRLFTREFYISLLKGGEIGAAAARGRRAAIAYGGYSPAATLHWAMPTLYLSEQSGPAKAVLLPNQAETTRYLQAREYNDQPAYPVFCDRWEVFKMFARLMGEKGALAGVSLEEKRPLALAIASNAKDNTDPSQVEKFGRTRLLKELAAQALRDGHVPILMSRPWLRKRIAAQDAQDNWPPEFKEFLVLLMGAVRHTRLILQEVDGLADLAGWNWTHLPKFLATYPTKPTVYPEMTADMADPSVNTLEALAMGLALDLLSFLSAASTGLSAGGQKNPRLLFLLDDAHQIAYSDELFMLLGKSGLRSANARDRIRVVLTYSKTAVQGQADMIDDLKDWANDADVQVVGLGYLHRAVDYAALNPQSDLYQEAALVYQHFLMNWKDDIRIRPLALKVPAPNQEDLKVIRQLIKNVQGRPSQLDSPRVNAVIDALVDTMPQALSPADDEAAISNLVNLRKRGL